MVTRPFEYHRDSVSNDDDFTFTHDHGRLPVAGVSSAKMKQHAWRKMTFGKQYDNAEPSFQYDGDDFERFQQPGHGANRHVSDTLSRARIDPGTTAVPAGASSRMVMKAQHVRMDDPRPGDAWQNNLGRAPNGQVHSGGRGMKNSIDFIAKKSKGTCNYDEPLDVIANADIVGSNHRAYRGKSTGKRMCERTNQQRPWSWASDPPDPNEPVQAKIQGLPNRIFVAVGGEKRLNICGAEDLVRASRTNAQDLVPSKLHVRTNDAKYLASCEFRPQWDQADCQDPVRNPNWNQSDRVWNLLDRQGMDQAISSDEKKAMARSRSMETAGRRASELTRWDKFEARIAANPGAFRKPPSEWRPWGEVTADSIAPSDSVSQTSMPKDCARRSQSSRGSKSARDLTAPMRRNAQEATVNSLLSKSEITLSPSGAVNHGSNPQGIAKRSQSARGSRSSRALSERNLRNLLAPSSRRDSEVGPSDSISQVSVPQSRYEDSAKHRSHPARGSQSARDLTAPQPRGSQGASRSQRPSCESGRSAQCYRRSQRS